MYRKLHNWLLVLSVIGAVNHYAFAQCSTGSLLNAGATTGHSSVAQSFVIDCPADGFFSTITILNTSNATDVTLQIIRGANLNGPVQYTQTGISLQLLSPTENIITLQGGEGDLAITAGNAYIFRLTAQTPLFLSKNIGSAQASNYPDGQLFQGNAPQPAQDLLFSVTTTPADPLPVQLSSFEAWMEDDNAVLQWETESEQNNAGFEIQYSRNARRWIQIGFVEGQGTTTRKHTYEYVHPQPGAGLHYYRLLQVDYDGARQASPPQVVEGKAAAGAGLRIYPNPVRKGAPFYVSGYAPAESFHARLFDGNGREAARFSNAESFRLPAAAPPGVYLLEATLDSVPSLHRLQVVD